MVSQIIDRTGKSGMPGGFTPVIVGYGRAGHLHQRCLSDAVGGTIDMVIADPVKPKNLPPGAIWLPSLPEVLQVIDPHLAVFHVTTPVQEHVRAVEILVDAGAEHIILEKPMAATGEQARRIAEVARERADLAPVEVWTASAVTQKIMGIISDGSLGEITALRFEQHKPRFTRSSDDRAHDSAFQVELPHQILLALYLVGPAAKVQDVRVWPMAYPGGPCLPDRGGVRLALLHRNGVQSVLVSDLSSPVRMRRLQILAANDLTAHFPIGDDDIGCMRTPGQRWTFVNDAPLTQFISSAYIRFAKKSVTPDVDLSLHLQSMAILDEAREKAVRMLREEAITTW